MTGSQLYSEAAKAHKAEETSQILVEAGRESEKARRPGVPGVGSGRGAVCVPAFPTRGEWGDPSCPGWNRQPRLFEQI